MDPKKASLPAAAIALSVASFVAGQKVAAPPPVAPRIVSLQFDPAPTLTVAAKVAGEVKRRRVVCSSSPTMDGKVTEKTKPLCEVAEKSAKLLADAVGSSGDLFTVP